MRAAGLFALVVVDSLWLAQSALACSCAAVPPREMLRDSDGAVVARLLRIRPVDDADDGVSSADPTDFVYRTGRVVKGRPRLRKGRRLVVRSVRSDVSCGLSGRPGELTGLFLARRGGRWHSGSCSQISVREMRRLARSRSRARAGRLLRPRPRSRRACASMAPGRGFR